MTTCLAVLVEDEAHAPTVPSGTLNQWMAFSPPDVRGIFAVDVDAPAYAAIKADNGVNGFRWIADLDTFPPLLDTDIRRITSTSNSGAGTLRDAMSIDGVKLAVVEAGGYTDLNTGIAPHNSRAVEGGYASAPVIYRMSASGVRDAFNVGLNAEIRRDIILRNISVQPGRGAGSASKSKHNGISINNGFCFLDHCSFILSNNEALVYLNTALGKAVVGATNPNVVAWDCIFGQTLYEETDSSNPEGLHPMNVNGQEQGYGIFRCCLLINCEQRNPRITEGSTGLFVDCYIYGHSHVATVNSTAQGTTRLELAGVVIRAGKRTSSRATIDQSDGSPAVLVYTDVVRLLKDGTEDTVNSLLDGAALTVLDTPTIAPTLDKAALPAAILASAGARLPQQSQADQLLVYQAANRLGDQRIGSLAAFWEQDENPLAVAYDARGYSVTP